MRKKTSEYLNRVRFEQLPDIIKKVILFGSEVYGKPNVFSDIDVAVISEVRLTLEQKAVIDQIFLDALPPSEIQYVYINYPLPEKFIGLDVRKNILERGVVLYDREKLQGYSN